MFILAVDPGETSGYVLAEDAHALQWGQWSGLAEFTLMAIPLIQRANVIVVEDYRVYAHKAQQHIGSQLYTSKEIGRIELVAYLWQVQITKESPVPTTLPDNILIYQMAGYAKGRWPNTRLNAHYPHLIDSTRGKGHIRDAMRHWLSYLEKNGHPFPIKAPVI